MQEKRKKKYQIVETEQISSRSYTITLKNCKNKT
jgi:hypothetical protein